MVSPDTGMSWRAHRWVIVAAVLAGGVVRAAPLIRYGARGSFIDYDEGVYFSSTAELAHGHLPYRDFVFPHPPGWPILMLPFGLLTRILDVSFAFGLTRWAMVAVGMLNVALVARIATKQFGRVAGVSAALIYAASTTAAASERGTFLEPLLNTFVLLTALWWLDAEHDRDRRLWWAGVACGVAISIKFWGLLILVPCLATATRERVRRLALATAATVAVIVMPFALAAPSEFLRETMQFQISRPHDGAGRLSRLPYFGPSGFAYVLVGGLVAGAVVLGARRFRETGATRFAVVWWLTIAVAFLLTPSFWRQYRSYLVPAEALLVGLSVSWIVRWAQTRDRRVGYAAAAILVLIPFALSGAAATNPQPDPVTEQTAQAAAAMVPDGVCLFAFEPAWGLLANRLPPVDVSPAAVDPYSAMLSDFVSAGGKASTVGEAFQQPASQRMMRELIDRCPFLMLGPRGARQLNAASLAEVQATRKRLLPVRPGVTSIDLWGPSP